MFCLGKMSLGAAIGLVAVCGLGSSSSAYADTYQVYDIGDGGNRYVQGINAKGDVLFYNGNAGPLYSVFDHGTAVKSSTSPIPFTKDDGTACTVAYGGASYAGLCNGAYEAFAIHYANPNSGLYVGRGGVFNVLDAGNSFVQPFFLNALGDLGYTDIGKDESFQAYNTPTPEPGTWVMLLTGVGVAFVGQRKLFA